MFRDRLVFTVLMVAPVSLGGCDRPVKRSDEGSATRPSDAGPATNPSTTASATKPSGAAGAPSTGAPATRPGTRAGTNPAQHDLEERLYGTWVAEDVDVSMGQVKIRLVFKKEGPVKIAAWSDMPFVGKVRDKTAPYEVSGNTISSEAIRGGTTVKYRFDGDDLVIEYEDGKTVRFRRAQA